MRTETEMMNLIINTAKSDDRVLAVYLKGSRANPNVTKDIYQDYDIMYVVEETESFLFDQEWIKNFGKVILKQEQDYDFSYGDRFGIRDHYDESYSWLLLFEDGNRIDIGVETLETMRAGRNRNKLFVPLLDKGGDLPQMPEPTDEEFWIKRPTEKSFYGCCNEFFWCLCDVAKGIARDELPFAMTTYNTLVRNMLELMLSWHIGIENDFTVSSGKLHKYFKKYLSEEIYLEYLKTYTDSDYEHFWNAIDISCKLFHKMAFSTAEYLGYEYPQDDENGALQYINKIRREVK